VSDIVTALGVALQLARAGVPVFLAHPARHADRTWDPTGGTGHSGYRLPQKWEQTVADPDVVGRWQPGMALAAVMGHVVDGLDVDPRNGGTESVQGLPVPRVHGVQVTPSGGWHGLIAPLGVGSRDGIRPGVDVKGGKSDGTGRGFLWIAPTVKLSKATGELAAYTWSRRPDLTDVDTDSSGRPLAEIIEALRRGPAAEQRPAFESPGPASSDRALMGLVDVVLRATEGKRNSCLHWAACRAAEHHATGRLDWSTAERALTDAARAIGLGEREVTATLKSARKAS
jgi:hypothetical protein